MRKMIIILIGVLVGLTLVVMWLNVLPTSAIKNVELRAAMDIGSGATNMKIAKVDRSTDKIISIIFEQSIPVGYQKQLEQTGDDLFNRATMDEGIKAISALKEMADSYQVKKIVGVATAAFRQAKNSEAFAKEIKDKTGVEVKVISQDEEGFLGFTAALSKVDISADQVVVWDIGGGSMQMTLQKQGEGYLVAKGATSSAPFKNLIVDKVQGKDPSKVPSPNPMSAEQMAKAIQLSSGIAVQSINDEVKAKLQEKGTAVLAVGTLFNYGIRPLVKGEAVASREAIEKAVDKMKGLSDTELAGGAFADVTVSNPLLVIGFMKALGIEKVTIVSANNTDGVLTYAPFWVEV
jgi:exopolyphosphatase / guanosine-5'-triphosphate,3'-diphosphate pyrophosphatase